MIHMFAPKHIPIGYEWIIVEDAKTIFRGYMRKIQSMPGGYRYVRN